MKILDAVSDMKVVFEGLEMPSGAGIKLEGLRVTSCVEVVGEGISGGILGAGIGLEGLGETAGLSFDKEGGVNLRPSENKRLVCFVMGAWWGW